MMRCRIFALGLLMLGSAVTCAASAVKGTVYTKRLNTALLQEPLPLATITARVGYARPLRIEEERGLWLKVSGPAGTGWVFRGNVTTQPPSEIGGLEGQPVSAAPTSATAAARPLSQDANEYAVAHDLLNARDDILWMEKHADAVKSRHVEAYLKAQKKGEFQ
jgi:hypothetical protein